MLRLSLSEDSIVQRQRLSRREESLRPLFDLVRSVDVFFKNLRSRVAVGEEQPILDRFACLSAAFGTCLDQGTSTAKLTA